MPSSADGNTFALDLYAETILQECRTMMLQHVFRLLLRLLVIGAVWPALAVADPQDRTITAPGSPFSGRPYWEVLARCAGVQLALAVADTADTIVRADPKQKGREAIWATFHGKRDALEDTGLLFLSSADGFLIEDRHVTKKEAGTIHHQQFDQGEALALEVAVREANLCSAAYQLCQAQYPKTCNGKLP